MVWFIAQGEKKNKLHRNMIVISRTKIIPTRKTSYHLQEIRRKKRKKDLQFTKTFWKNPYKLYLETYLKKKKKILRINITVLNFGQDGLKF